jgi:hypothetical protein
MWVLFARTPRPDAAYWPGRRWLGALDAIAWPALWIAVFANAPVDGGIVKLTATAFATLSAARRTHRALWHNERYWFTTWRWGVPLATLVSLAWAMKLLA